MMSLARRLAVATVVGYLVVAVTAVEVHMGSRYKAGSCLQY